MTVKPDVTVEWEFDPGVWTDISDDVVAIRTRRGRNVELGAYETGSMTVVLRNEDRDYDPDHDAGPYHGKLRPNRRIRFQADWDTITHLDLPGTSGAYTSTPDSPALSITGDIDIRVKFAKDNWSDPGDYFFFKRSGNAGYGLRTHSVDADFLEFIWGTGSTSKFQKSTAAVPFLGGDVGWVRVTLDVNNGAGGNDVKFFTSDDGDSWTQLGSTKTDGSLTAIADGADALRLFHDGGTNAVAGKIYYAEIRDGIDGTVVASPSFDTRSDPSDYTSSTTLVDDQGNVWTRHGAATFATTPTTYPVFVGYVDRITQTYDGPNRITATVDLSDRFKILNRAELPASVYAAEVAATAPVLWYRLDEPVDATVAVEVGGQDAAVEGTVLFGVGGLIVRDGGTAMTPQPEVISGTQALPAGIRVPPASFPQGTAAFTFEFWLSTTTTTTADTPILAVDGADNFRIGVTTVGPNTVLYVRFGTATNVYFLGINDGAAHHVAVTRAAANANVTIYVDGVSQGTLAVGAGAALGPYLLFGSAGDTPTTVSGGFILDDFAIYDTALSAGTLVTHNAAARTPWTGDTAAERMERILALAAVDPADYTIDGAPTTLQATDLGGSALAYAQRIEQTELGAFYVARDGEIMFVGRDALQTGGYLDVAAELADDPAAGDVPYRDVALELDEADVITRATISRGGGVAVTYVDPDAYDEFGPIDYVADGLLHDTDTYSGDYAEWVVNTHRTPASRVGTVTVRPPADPDVIYPAILNLEIGDRVTFTRRPKTGNPISGEFRVESIAHQVAAGWDTTLQLSPFNPGEDNQPVFVWDETAWDNHVWGF